MATIPKREGEPEDVLRFRSDRYSVSNGQWFCATREGRLLGPFENRDEAEVAVRDYLVDIEVLEVAGRMR